MIRETIKFLQPTPPVVDEWEFVWSPDNWETTVVVDAVGGVEEAPPCSSWAPEDPCWEVTIGVPAPGALRMYSIGETGLRSIPSNTVYVPEPGFITGAVVALIVIAIAKMIQDYRG